LKTCVGSNNDTVLDCPVYGKHYKEEFIVLVHNQAAQARNNFVRIRLPTNKYKASVWSKSDQAFVESNADILEQSHILNDRRNFTDFLMYVPCDIPPNEVTFVRVTKILEAVDNKT